MKLSPVIFPDSDVAEKLPCGRTKAEALVANVLAPKSKEMLISDLTSGSACMGAARHGQGGTCPPPWKCANGYLKPQSGICNCICCRPNCLNRISGVLPTYLKVKNVHEFHIQFHFYCHYKTTVSYTHLTLPTKRIV